MGNVVEYLDNSSTLAAKVQIVGFPCTPLRVRAHNPDRRAVKTFQPFILDTHMIQ